MKTWISMLLILASVSLFGCDDQRAKEQLNSTMNGWIGRDINEFVRRYGTPTTTLTLRHYGQGDEVAGMVSYLASSEAAFVTGASLKAEEIQLDLILDYRSNVALYPAFQSYFREHRPPLLAVWGRHDPAFLPAGAAAYQRDLPDAKIHLLNAGHFALETHAEEVATLIRAFLDSAIGSTTVKI